MTKKATTGASPTRSAITYLCDGIEAVLDRFLVPLLMASLAFIVFFQVINRFILHIPAAWTEEMGRYLFVWASLLGAVSGVRRGAHLNVEIVQNAVKGNFRRILMLASDIFCIIFFGVLGYQGLYWVKTSGINVLADSMDIPMLYIQVIVPVSAILMLIFTAEHIYRVISKHNNKEAGDCKC